MTGIIDWAASCVFKRLQRGSNTRRTSQRSEVIKRLKGARCLAS